MIEQSLEDNNKSDFSPISQRFGKKKGKGRKPKHRRNKKTKQKKQRNHMQKQNKDKSHQNSQKSASKKREDKPKGDTQIVVEDREVATEPKEKVNENKAENKTNQVDKKKDRMNVDKKKRILKMKKKNGLKKKENSTMKKKSSGITIGTSPRSKSGRKSLVATVTVTASPTAPPAMSTNGTFLSKAGEGAIKKVIKTTASTKRNQEDTVTSLVMVDSKQHIKQVETTKATHPNPKDDHGKPKQKVLDHDKVAKATAPAGSNSYEGDDAPYQGDEGEPGSQAASAGKKSEAITKRIKTAKGDKKGPKLLQNVATKPTKDEKSETYAKQADHKEEDNEAKSTASAVIDASEDDSTMPKENEDPDSEVEPTGKAPIKEENVQTPRKPADHDVQETEVKTTVSTGSDVSGDDTTSPKGKEDTGSEVEPTGKSPIKTGNGHTPTEPTDPDEPEPEVKTTVSTGSDVSGDDTTTPNGKEDAGSEVEPKEKASIKDENVKIPRKPADPDESEPEVKTTVSTESDVSGDDTTTPKGKEDTGSKVEPTGKSPIKKGNAHTSTKQTDPDESEPEVKTTVSTESDVSGDDTTITKGKEDTGSEVEPTGKSPIKKGNAHTSTKQTDPDESEPEVKTTVSTGSDVSGDTTIPKGKEDTGSEVEPTGKSPIKKGNAHTSTKQTDPDESEPEVKTTVSTGSNVSGDDTTTPKGKEDTGSEVEPKGKAPIKEENVQTPRKPADPDESEPEVKTTVSTGSDVSDTTIPNIDETTIPKGKEDPDSESEDKNVNKFDNDNSLPGNEEYQEKSDGLPLQGMLFCTYNGLLLMTKCLLTKAFLGIHLY